MAVSVWWWYVRCDGRAREGVSRVVRERQRGGGGGGGTLNMRRSDWLWECW